ncbi:VOC family protein [Microbacterium sp. SORGH_AS_0888]|uniref:VOC family protein n=1 Tax=Microbacterium sp. SORGH_AS_0888 TaxID=3041791 RepID=UPI002783FD14|nr:VOC family protein [Microbacterium sp. SORGH_AS_0888]MDQ1130099.1 catechol 2,3-dioxygenase-like lactoylglutathione lyase family enzyme [Microbacterium sp. SORGH_AS_0888]
MQFAHFDHLVLTVESVDASVAFYTRLGFEYIEHDGRHSVRFAQNKINLHPVAKPLPPFAAHPTPGSGDFCVIVHDTIDRIIAEVDAAGVAIEVGPVRRNGAQGPMDSVYVRDPDRNLVEFATYTL